MSTCLSAIALGANLGDPIAAFAQAVKQITALPATHLIAHSSFYQSAALGPRQADYINTAILVKTGLPALQLLQSLQAIEDNLGRRRDGVRWGPRPIDLDIITYGQSVINEPTLVIPHPEAYHRCFVLAPLVEICPQLVLPGYGVVTELLASCDSGTIKLIHNKPALVAESQPQADGDQNAQTGHEESTMADQHH